VGVRTRNGFLVLSFPAVEKKRALKKEEWPVSSSLEVPNRYDVNVQLMAGNVEIQQCDGCASWKDKTRKPFLVLTPTGDRVIQFLKNPFILLIFRCCPKFHSCNKQFRLIITVTSPITGDIYRNEVNIHRKKMVSTKKRKTTPTEQSVQSLPIPTAASMISRDAMENMMPIFPYTKQTVPVVSPQLMYQLLYSDKDMKCAIFTPLSGTEPTASPILHHIKLEPQTSKLFWNLDTPSNLMRDKSQDLGINDEKWLDSVFDDEGNLPPSLPTTVDDIGALLDLPTYTNMAEILPHHF